ncbi:MAG: glycosyltransferase [Bacteroidota bacterium]|nr:glycosyltransferase [Bacteroidota bacterium]
MGQKINLAFSIILPVRNGGEYVKECINSILAQTIQDFNLIVLDNFSSDGTMQWIESLNDERILIYPSEKPLSIEENWGRIVSIPKNEFMTIIGHDDVLNQDYLSVMNDLICKFPDACLYQTHFAFIDSKGKKIKQCKPMQIKENGPQFLQTILQNKIDIVGTGFMMRSKDYDDAGGIPLYPNLLYADFELWINLTGKSYKATSEKEGFYFRLHQSTTSISSDINMNEAFKSFIYFLNKLKHTNQKYDAVIKNNADKFISFYCKGLSHRLLRTPIQQRKNLSVISFINQCKKYSEILTGSENFKPFTEPTLFLATIIDSNFVTRKLFLLLKMVYNKPVLK